MWSCLAWMALHQMAGQFEGVEGKRRLLRSASRGAGAKPIVTSEQAFTSSGEFQSLVASLGSLPASGLSMAQLVGSLSETVADILQPLWTGTWAAGAVQEAVRDLDDGGRNVLHHAAAGGASPVIQSLAAYLEGLRGVALDDPDYALASGTVAVLGEAVSEALQSADRRGLTPMDYAALRWGNSTSDASDPAPGAVTGAMLRLASAAGTTARTGFGGAVSAPREPARGGIGGSTAEQVSPSSPPLGSPLAVLEESVTGGWDPTPWNPAEQISDQGGLKEERCDIAEVHPGDLPPGGLTSNYFFQTYVARGVPVIFRGAGVDLPSRRAFAKDSFVAKYGAWKVPVSTVPYAGSFGMPSAVTTLGALAGARQSAQESEALGGQSYAFSTAMPEWQRSIAEDAPPPAFLSSLLGAQPGPGGSFETQFFLGPAGSGAPVHFHGHAVNCLAFGTKQWFLYPPAQAFYSKTPAEQWVLTNHSSSSPSTPASSSAESTTEPFQCVQRAGDIMFVPTLWGHGTLNLHQSIGTAYEFSLESFCME